MSYYSYFATFIIFIYSYDFTEYTDKLVLPLKNK